MQTMEAVSTEYVPAAQLLQAAEPVVLLNFPSTQGVHVPPFGPVNPARHTQFANAALPAAEVVL